MPISYATKAREAMDKDIQREDTFVGVVNVSAEQTREFTTRRSREEAKKNGGEPRRSKSSSIARGRAEKYLVQWPSPDNPKVAAERTELRNVVRGNDTNRRHRHPGDVTDHVPGSGSVPGETSTPEQRAHLNKDSKTELGPWKES